MLEIHRKQQSDPNYALAPELSRHPGDKVLERQAMPV
jgi:hypothetical protein